MNDLTKFYESTMQDIAVLQASDEEIGSSEQAFTRICEDMLAEAGETENASLAYDEQDLGRKGQLKINGYAISENYETVDLFISIFNNSPDIRIVPKAEVDTAVKRIRNFFKKAIYGHYTDDIAESSEIFEFADTLANYSELRDNLIRVNAYILTNGMYDGDVPPYESICGYTVFYRIIDINFLYKISEQSHMPIELDFTNLDGKNYEIPCLAANIENPDYKAYVAIISGECLSVLYRNYGDRLLEQNVRSFLQFSGKINKGIRKTIRETPHMFLAYNNGIAATADHIELDDYGRNIKSISNLQIVNGGQTTASIFNTAKKDKADISQIFVQVKISVIKDQDQYSEIVSNISQYANTQNKVNDADFSANNPKLIEIEKLSRSVLTPMTPNLNIPTCWFFERARGQYKTLRAKDGFTKARRIAFDRKFPKSQMFTKVELAKYINSWDEVYSGRSIVIGPYIVVRGNEKNYARFRNYNLPDLKQIDVAFFEDTIAKAILFKTADKRYGTKLTGNPIGELKQVVVPYTLALLNVVITEKKIDLYKIWKNQCISRELSDFIYDLMKQVNAFIIKESPITHYIEWAKKEECWQAIKQNEWSFNISAIEQDFIDPKNPPKRNHKNDSDDGDNLLKYKEGIVKSIPFLLWKKIESWGRDTGSLQPTYISLASDLAYRIKNKRKISDNDISRGYSVYEIVWEKNQELLEEADALAEKDKSNVIETQPLQTDDITLELIEQMIEWDRRRKVLEDWKWKVMKDVVDGKKILTDKMKYAFYLNLEKLRKKGFPN